MFSLLFYSHHLFPQPFFKFTSLEISIETLKVCVCGGCNNKEKIIVMHLQRKTSVVSLDDFSVEKRQTFLFQTE